MAGEIKGVTAKENLKKYYEEGWQIATWLNDHPEISGQEKESSRYLIELLKKRGYRVESPCQGVKYSFRAVKKGKGRKRKPKIAVLCEYDSIEGLGQACGHSLSCAASIICANVLNELWEDLPFQVDLIGTPGEEVHGGKISLLQKGVFNEYECAVIAHMNNVNQPSFKILLPAIWSSTIMEKRLMRLSNRGKGQMHLTDCSCFSMQQTCSVRSWNRMIRYRV